MSWQLPGTRYRAVIFDLEHVLLAREGAWCYTVEEAIASVTARRIDTRPLAREYANRPWRHVLSVLLDDSALQQECEELCAELFTRSAMKRLLVHEGVGMALDHLRAARIEIGAVSREPHATALKQVQSTGLDRFLAVLSTTPAGGWDVSARLLEALSFLEYRPAECAFVSSDGYDLGAARTLGFTGYTAAWASSESPPSEPLIASPAEIASLAYT